MKPFFGKDLGESMFADNAKIFIKSGKGGDGHVSFRKELFVPAGGPDGGDGGKGGDIIFEVDPGLNTLTDFRHVRKYVARDGEQGGKKRCHGANAENLVIKVPEGTVIKDFETGKVSRGLGLSLVKDIVEEELGGVISVKSQNGCTDFTIRIPRENLEVER